MIELETTRVFDNAFAGRALRFPLRPGRLGVLLLFHAVLLLLVLYGVHRLHAWTEFRREMALEVGFGRVLLGVLACVELLLVTLCVPFRCGLVLYAERRNRCLDQLAASGVSPLSMCWGHLACTIAGVALHLVCALPYFCSFFLDTEKCSTKWV